MRSKYGNRKIKAPDGEVFDSVKEFHRWGLLKLMERAGKISDLKRQVSFELIPKLNFSACHDIWLKDYSRMLSTPIYYEVCRDVIQEVCEVFKPRYFHLGMDEEDEKHVRKKL